MMTMSDDGDRTCPLCAEEMDLTDQQLKPCKCGYEICVWCWHHIMDMAAKDGTEGKCPACRTLYDRERIVGTNASCERVLAEINAERRHKPQKGKPKMSAEARKQLADVRVVRRNLVYIVGLPVTLSDESLLERREYFGQYGKVLKVSISRPAGAMPQQTSNFNNTFGVYITYTWEEEAIRCIQAVHNFVLEGKPLRACFGTTKYCHSWLRNMTCNNPDCMYLHDVGSQEDSFTKDEIISAYTRSRVPQIAPNNLQRRWGNTLPAPVDDLSNSIAVPGNRQTVKSAPNSTLSEVKASTSSAGKSTVLPAAASWELRSSSCRSLSATSPCSQNSVKQKAETVDDSSVLSSINTGPKPTSSWHDGIIKPSRISEGRQMNGVSKSLGSSKADYRSTILSEVPNVEAYTAEPSAWDDDLTETSKILEEKDTVHTDGRSVSVESLRSGMVRDCETCGSNVSSKAYSDTTSSHISVSSSDSLPVPVPKSKGSGISIPGNNKNPVITINLETPDIGTLHDELPHIFKAVDGKVQSLSMGSSLVCLGRHPGADDPNIDGHESSVSLSSMPKSSSPRSQQFYQTHRVEGVSSEQLIKSSVLPYAPELRESSDWNSESQKHIFLTGEYENENTTVVVDNHRHGLPNADDQTPCSSNSNDRLAVPNHSSDYPWNDVGSAQPSVNGNSITMDINTDKALFPCGEDDYILSNEHKEDSVSHSYKLGKTLEFPEVNYTKEKVNCVGRFDDKANTAQNANVDIGENNIISDILSLDFDPWNDSLSLANDFAKLLSEMDKQDNSFIQSSYLKAQNNQSRFSFARQEDQTSLVESSLRDVGYTKKSNPSLHDSYGHGFQNGPQFNNFDCHNAIVDSNPPVSFSKPAGVPRAKISAPPGFSLTSKAPPPGFSFQDRYEQACDTTYSENHLHGNSLHDNQYQGHLTENTADVEFIDPAILAVGRLRMPLGVTNLSLGLRSAFPSQLSTSDSDLRLQLSMQQSISSPQNPRMSDHFGDRFLPSNDAYVTSRLSAQNHVGPSPFAQLSFQQPRNALVSSNQWNGWNNVQTGSDVTMAEILRNERLGLNNYFPGHDEHKFHIPSSADLYNRAFGV